MKYPEDEILNIAMAAGLSGTYDSAVAASQMGENTGRITVINSRTLCGPYRYLVENAVKMVKPGKFELSGLVFMCLPSLLPIFCS